MTFDGGTWKVKFGEERNSGPFSSRIFWALGYPSDVVDFVHDVKIKWDRRILTDFNSRKSNATRISFAGIPIATMKPSTYFNPFEYIKYAVLADGSHVDSKTLESKLFLADSKGKRRELHKDFYDKSFEGKINYLVMADASITPKDVDGVTDLGFWSYNNLDHPMLREVRGMAMLDAWLDNWDIRWGNNRLELVEDSKGKQHLEHVVSDLGAAFGNSSGMLRRVNGHVHSGLYQNAPNDFMWACTHPQSPDMTTVPVYDYMTITKAEPFYLMNLDDARWMCRLLSQLSERQIKEALIGSGLDSAEARLLEEKLVSRRDSMVRDLGLTSEIAMLRPGGVDRRLTYDPRKDAPVEAMRPSGSMVVARSGGDYLLTNGTLKRVPELSKDSRVANK